MCRATVFALLKRFGLWRSGGCINYCGRCIETSLLVVGHHHYHHHHHHHRHRRHLYHHRHLYFNIRRTKRQFPLPQTFLSATPPPFTVMYVDEK